MDNQNQQAIDIKEYHAFGIPVLKLLAGIAAFSFIATAIYEHLL